MTTSADPKKLHDFLTGVKAARHSAETTQRSVASLSTNMIAACDGYVSIPALGALSTLLDSMGENETFVRTIRTELLAADNSDGGPITISDAAIAASLRSKGVGTPPAPVQFDPLSIVGIPQTSGFVDDPICAANGNMIHQDVDLRFPVIAGALDLIRTYNSVMHERVGAFGAGWSCVLDCTLVRVDGGLAVQLPDGAIVTFTEARDGWATDSRRAQRLVELDGGGYVVHLDHERRLRFDVDGLLNGWDAGVAVVEVDRLDGRIVGLAEQWSGRSVRVVWTGDVVTTATASDGRVVDYRRDDRGRLEEVSTRSGRLRYAWTDDLLQSVIDDDDVVLFANAYDRDGRVVQQTSPFGRVTSYRYDDSGATVISDDRGVRQAMVHDGRGNLTAVIDTDGSAMRITYDGQDRAVRVVSKSGAEWRYDFDDHTGDLLRRHDPDGLSQAWTWDHLGRPLTETDRTGAVTTFEYAGDFRTPVRVVGPDDSVAIATLAGNGRPAELTDADGVVRRLEWDRDGQLTNVTDAFGATTTFEFDDAGLLTRLVDAAGADTRLSYEHGRVERSERGAAVSTYRRTAAGRINGGSEPGGTTWSATFGPHGALETLSDAVGSTVRYEYDTLGDVVAVVAPDGDVYRSAYDDLGRLVSSSDPSGASLRKGYDVNGHLVEFTDPEGGTTRRTLDELGRTIESIAADGSATRWTYHPNGETATVTEPDGRIWSTEVDELGRVVAIIDPSGGRATRAYSPGGRLLSRTSPAGRTERFEYDPAGRCIAVTGVDGVRRRLKLDAVGRVVAIDVDPPGSTHSAVRNLDGADDGEGPHAGPTHPSHAELLWDDHWRLTGYRDDRGEASYDRDPAGRLRSATDATGVTTRFTWDERGLLGSAIDAAGAVSTYRHDQRGRLAAQVMPGQRTTTWSYDEAGRVGAMTDPAGTAIELIRDDNGLVTGSRHGDDGWNRRLDPAGRELERSALDGTVLGRYHYDVVGRMTSAEAPSTGLFTEFLWDDTNRLTEVTDASGTSTIERDADGWTVAFTNQAGIRTVIERDRSGRMVALHDGDAGPFELPDEDAVRDPAGRLLIGPDGTVYRYDDAGRLAETAPADGESTRFEYGDDGLISTEHGPVGTRDFAYDDAGRVSSITVHGSGTTEIGYDDAGRRSIETDPDGTVTRYGWNALDQLIDIDRTTASGEHTSVHLDLDALGRPQRINDQPIGYDATAGRANLVGDVRILTVGDVTWRSDDAEWSRTRPGEPDGLRVGRMTLLGARVYDPVARQFLSPDPLMTVPGTNGAASAYTFAWQDPVNFVDPTGLRPVSKEEYDAIRTREEQGNLGRAWEAIKDDPWGSLAMVGVVAAGVGLMFVPGGQAIGAGILIGAAVSAGTGLATGTFDPRQVALGGLIGGVGGGAAAMGLGTAATVATGAGLGGGGDLASQALSGQPIDWHSVGVSTALGGITAGVGAQADPLITTPRRAFAAGAVTEGASNVTQQALTGDGPIDWNEVAISAGGGGAQGTADHYFAVDPPAFTETPPVATPSAPRMPAIETGPPQLALPAGHTPPAIEAGHQPLAIEAPTPRLAIEAPRTPLAIEAGAR